MLKAEAEAENNSSRPSPRPMTKFWPRGQLVLEDFTSLTVTVYHYTEIVKRYFYIVSICAAGRQ